MTDLDHGSWGEYRRLVLAELQRVHDDLDKLEKAVTSNSRDIQQLVGKVAVFGAVAGAVCGGIVAAIASALLG